VVDATSPLGQALEPFQLITAESAAFVGDEEEHVKGLEAKVPSICGVPKSKTIPELVEQPDKVASMEVWVPPPDAVSGGVNVVVPVKEHVAAAPVTVVVVGPAAVCPMEMVPDTTTDRTPLVVQEPRGEETRRLNTTAPGNDPLDLPPLSIVGATSCPAGPLPRHLINAESVAPV
jgi:hypothetical protein